MYIFQVVNALYVKNHFMNSNTDPFAGKMGDSPRSILASPATSEVSGKKSRKS